LTALPKREMNEDEAKNYVSKSAQAHQSAMGATDGVKWSGCKLALFLAFARTSMLTLFSFQSRFNLSALK